MPSHGFAFEARRTSMSRLPSSLLRLTLRRLQHQRRRSEELAASQTADVVVLSCGTTATKGEAVMDCLTISQLKQIVRWTLQQYWANRHDDDAARRRDEDDAALLFSPTSSRQASSPRHVHFAPAGRPKRRTASSPKSGSRLGMKDGVSNAELAVPQQAVAALAEECVRLAQNMAELVVGYSLLRVKVDETDVAQVNNAPKPFDIHRLHESVGSGWVYHESLSFAGSSADGGNITRDCLMFRLHHIQSISYHEKTIVMQGVLAALLTAEKTHEKRRKSLQASSALKASDEARANSETSDGGSSTTPGVSSSLESWLEDKHDSLGLVFDLRFVSLVSIERWEQRQLLMDCIMMLQESYPASVASVTVFCSTNLMRAAVEELVRTLHKDTALPITVRSRSHHVDLHSLTPLSTRPIVVDIFVVPVPSPSTMTDNNNNDNNSREAWEGSWQRAVQRFKVDESVGSPSRGSSLSRGGTTTSLPRSSTNSDPNWPFLNAVAAAILPAETDGSGFLRWWGDLVNARAEQINDWFDKQHPSAGGSVMRFARSTQRFDRETLAFGYAGEHYDSPSGSSASSSSDSNSSDSDDMNDDSVRSSRNRPRVPPPPAAASDSEDSPFRSATAKLQTEDVRLQESEEEDLPQEGPEEDPLTESQWNEAALENDFPSSNDHDSSRSNSNNSPPLLGTGDENVLPPVDSDDEEEEEFGPVEEGSLSGSSSSSSTSSSSSSPKSPDARSLQGESNTGGEWDEKDWAGEVREQSRAWRSEPQEHVLLHDKRYLAAQETAARLQIANDASDLWHVLLEDAAVELEAVRAVVRMQRNARLPFAMKVLREAENSARRALDLSCVCEFHHILDLAVQHRKQLADFEEQRWKLEYQEASQRGIVRAQELRSRDFISSADFDGSEMSPSSQEPLLRSNEEDRDSLQVSRREDDETAADPPLTLDEQDCSNDMTVDRSSTATTVHYENSQLLQTTEASFLQSSPNPQNLPHNNAKDDDEEDSAAFPSPIRTHEETTEALLMGPAMLTSGQRREVLREVGVEETRRGLQPLLTPQPQREPLRDGNLSSDEPIVMGSPEIVYNGYEEF